MSRGAPSKAYVSTKRPYTSSSAVVVGLFLEGSRYFEGQSSLHLLRQNLRDDAIEVAQDF